MYSSTQEQVTTESGNRQNIFPIEAQPQLIESYPGYLEDAEISNGRWAMIGFVALIGAYAATGQIIPGIL